MITINGVDCYTTQSANAVLAKAILLAIGNLGRTAELDWHPELGMIISVPLTRIADDDNVVIFSATLCFINDLPAMDDTLDGTLYQIAVYIQGFYRDTAEAYYGHKREYTKHLCTVYIDYQLASRVIKIISDQSTTNNLLMTQYEMMTRTDHMPDSELGDHWLR